MISDQIIEQILDATDIVDLIGQKVKLTKKGNRYVGLCPFHGEKTPSFQVTPAMNFWYCFGCHEGGNVIKFLMKYDNLDFRQAIKELAKYNNISLPDEQPISEAEKQKQLKREAMYMINDKVAAYYHSNINDNKAKVYINSRWDMDFAVSVGMGYALPQWDGLYNFAKANHLSIDLLLELGLLKKNEEKNRIYDFYRDRIVIPIYNKLSHIIGFTCRDISKEDGVAKYLNSSKSDIYDKDNSIFGINNAFREGVRRDKIYCVEGAPDVLRMHMIGVPNTVAALGSSWTDHQFSQIKKMTSNICFIPDADIKKSSEDYPVGIKSVMDNGKKALQMGFNVTVCELPNGEGNTKNDPDSFCTSKQKFNSLKEEDFIVWFAEKLFSNKTGTDAIHSVITEVCTLITLLGDEMKEEMYLSKVRSFYKNKDLWAKAIKFARTQRKARQVLEKGKIFDRELYMKYGFFEKNGGYYMMDPKGGGDVQWSNFTMIPMFHIKDAINPKRMYRIKNTNNQEEIIEMKQEDLASLSKFRQRVEGLGNYIFEATDRELIKLKKFLYEQTDTAIEITKMGWQRQGFYAFGNGIYRDNQWKAVDEYGIVKFGKNENYYLPASSKIYVNDDKLFQFERKFVHLNYNAISMREVAEKIISVYGDNGKVGLCFLLSALFRDIIVSHTKSFPILNLFGQKGAGKSELGNTLMSFFIIRNTPPNISNATIASLNDTIAQCSNAIVHLDEFKNDIDIEKREFLKGLWDGTGRTRMNMERDKKREITSVDSAVIVSGQEMATADIALFSRFVFLQFQKTEYTKEEKALFMDLNKVQSMGLTHLTLGLLSHRAKMQQGFVANYKQCGDDILDILKQQVVEDRILRNWQTLLASFKTLESYIDFPFKYRDILPIFVDMIVDQNKSCKSSNELSTFWNMVSFLHQEGEIQLDGDYRIDTMDKLQTKDSTIQFSKPTEILQLRKNRLFMLYKKYARQVGDSPIPERTLESYLKASKEFCGQKNAVRFKRILKNGLEATKEVDTSIGCKERKITSEVDQALCFNYDMIKRAYDIDINVYVDDGDSLEF